MNILPGYAGGDVFGDSLDWVGDLDGDGSEEMVIGAVNTNPYTGAVYVVSPSGVLLYKYLGTSAYQNFGEQVAGLGDLDGDGLADFGASSLGFGSLGERAVIWSGADGSVLHIPAPAFGTAISRAADIDMDGRVDVLLGDTAYSEARVLLGGSFTTYLAVFPPTVGTVVNFGIVVKQVGDVDMDGVPDFAVGAPGVDSSCFLGFVGVYSGRTGVQIHGFYSKWNGLPMGADLFGWDLDGIFDISGDGINEIIVGAPQGVQVCSGQQGRVDVFDGFSGNLITSVVEGTNKALVGYSVESAGDLTGDGLGDFLVFVLDGNVGSDVVRLYSGQSLQPAYSAVSPFSNYLFGYDRAVAATHDIDNDGFPDFAVGTWDGQGSLPGNVYVYSGAPIGVSSLGLPCPISTGALPRIGVSSVPSIGSTLSIHLSGVPAGLQAVVLWGLSSGSWAGIPLPLNLGFIGIPNCDLLVSIEVSVPTITTPIGPNQGAASLAFPIPYNAALVGLSVYVQWFILNPSGSATIAATTRGLRITFQ